MVSGVVAGVTAEFVLIGSLPLLCTRFHAANQLRSVPSFSFNLSPRTQADSEPSLLNNSCTLPLREPSL